MTRRWKFLGLALAALAAAWVVVGSKPLALKRTAATRVSAGALSPRIRVRNDAAMAPTNPTPERAQRAAPALFRYVSLPAAAADALTRAHPVPAREVRTDEYASAASP